LVKGSNPLECNNNFKEFYKRGNVEQSGQLIGLMPRSFWFKSKRSHMNNPFDIITRQEEELAFDNNTKKEYNLLTKTNPVSSLG
jgi:hypothetical protein